MPLRPKYIAAERLSTYTFRSTDIGVVLDLMIHDLDLVLSLISAPVRSVAAVGVSVFGGHEDIANARIEFEDGCVANLTASRASFHAVRKMRLWARRATPRSTSRPSRGPSSAPPTSSAGARSTWPGSTCSNPAAIKDHLFGKILRVDQVQTEGREPLTLELEDFVMAVRDGTRPKVSGDDALRRCCSLIKSSRRINTHAWEGVSTGPLGPHTLPDPIQAPSSALRGPLSWRIKAIRQGSSAPVNP